MTVDAEVVVGAAEAFVEERNSEGVDGSSSRFARSACVGCLRDDRYDLATCVGLRELETAEVAFGWRLAVVTGGFFHS